LKKLEVYGLEIKDEIKKGTDLAKLIIDESRKQGCELKNGDIVVVTSKVVSKAAGKMYNLRDVRPSKKAKLLSKFFKGEDPRVMELIMRSGEIEYVIPIKELLGSFMEFFEKYSANKGQIRAVLGEVPFFFMTKRGGLILTDAGLDFSNSPKDHCTLPPEDPDKEALNIRMRIKELSGIDVAVVISDTEWKMDKLGSMDVAIGCSGITPISKKFAGRDRYGKPKFGGLDCIADLLAATANLLMGQTDESIPVVIIRGLKYERSDVGIKELAYQGDLLKKAIKLVIWETIKLKILLNLASLFDL